ncbi:MAG: butyrate kinase [Candidatus Muirbacterium halophilum]|nr:butyrate kinase [Candidatus Muirbacterium halophilum]MCK9477704.1 butyrate kinase [Candidatus Muirbacterium halophilum]
MRILTINPGSTSTKIGIYSEGNIQNEFSIEHSSEQVSKFKRSIEQKDMRTKIIKDFLKEKGYKSSDFDAISGRGAPLKPLVSGVYQVNEKMIYDLNNEVKADHPSILAAIIAKELADEAGINAYITDPVSVDEFDDIARISGMPENPRLSLGHTLNMKAVAIRLENDVKKKYEDMNLIICHLGGGISISAHKDGRMIDVNNANDDGPFSPERAGGLPAGQLVKLCFSGKFETDRDLKNYVNKKAGLIAYLGSNSLKDLMNKRSDKKVDLIISAMVYQIAKEIGKMATVLCGKVDYIVMTGGIANNKILMDEINNYTSFIANMKLYPGEGELLALGQGVERVLQGKQKVIEYV